jgi:hypothetical protein
MEDATIYAERGDTIIFSLLLDLVPRSDGYVSEGLGYNLASLFLKRPKYFLKQISRRPIDEQKGIATLTFFADGGGMQPEEFVKAYSILNKYLGSHDIEIHSTVNIFLSAIKYVRIELKN